MSDPLDPWADQRAELPSQEFDAVDYYVARMARAGISPPAPALGVYLDLDLAQPELGERLPDLLADLSGFLARTVPVPMHPGEGTRALVGQPPRSRRWRGPATLRWLVEGLSAGTAEGVSISLDGPDGAEDRFWFLDLACLPDVPGAAVELSLTASPNLWPEPAVDPVAAQVVELVRSWIGRLRILTGGITYDRVEPGDSPFERWYGLAPAQRARSAREYLRGYYWATLLGPDQVDRLGGADAVRVAAATHHLGVQLLDAGAGQRPAVLLRVPAPVTAVTDQHLAALKELLAPVLPAAPYVYYEGWPLRVLKDPGTAFRTVPADGPGPRLS